MGIIFKIKRNRVNQNPPQTTYSGELSFNENTQTLYIGTTSITGLSTLSGDQGLFF